MTNTYVDFASVYDELMDNIPYDEWFSYLHSLLIEYGISNGLVADIGCGTGTISELLSENGYEVIGTDISTSMLEMANAKRIANKSNTIYVCQDMRELSLHFKANAIISICDCINYILSLDELLQVFNKVKENLAPGGVFIFDFNTRFYYENVVGETTIAEDRDDVSFIWNNYFDSQESVNELSLSLFIKENEEDNRYIKHEEFHLQRGYELNEILDIIQKSNLTLLNAYDAMTRNEPTSKSERIYIIAK